MNQGVRLYVFVESAMKQSLKAPTPWKLLVDVLEPLRHAFFSYFLTISNFLVSSAPVFIL